MNSTTALCLLSVFIVGPSTLAVGQEPDRLPQTIAEKSEFTATSLHQDVIDFQESVAKISPLVTNREIGQTVNGKSMLATIVSKRPYKFGNQSDSRLIILLLGNIHSGECAGKEALLMLLRDLADGQKPQWLNSSVIVFLPNYNADGNDRIGRNEIHRPGQIGPSKGMGLRENAQQLDLNRDFIKTESPEAQALVGLINSINPHLFIDCHTTNGSRHRYQLTYDIPHNPTTHQRLRSFMRDSMMPAITSELESAGVSTFYYGNFSRDHSRWTTYGHQPRYSTEYVGLRGRLSVLSEAYSYISYKDRIFATKAFVESCIDYVVANETEVKDVLEKVAVDSADASTVQNLTLEAEVQPFEQKFTLKGYDGNSDTPKDYTLDFYGNYIAKKEKAIPTGYLLDKNQARVANRLLLHGVDVYEFRKQQSIAAHQFKVTEKRRGRSFQKHEMLSIDGEWNDAELTMSPGDFWVPTDQKLGRLAAYLLDPQSDDGLTTWNFFDSAIELTGIHPVSATSIRPLKSVRKITSVNASAELSLEQLYGETGKINFGGQPVTGLKWFDDRSYITNWTGRELLVDAESGNFERVPVLSARAAAARLQMQLKFSATDAAELVAKATRIDAGDAVVFNSQNDLFWFSKVDENVKRLTENETPEELVTASPDNKQIAFVRENDLYRINLASGKETRVTTNGSENRLNGKLDWVYQEELYGRGNFKGFWWSPDSQSIAYLSLDQSKVKRYRVTDHIPIRQRHEVYPYPKAGDPNPIVELYVDQKKVDFAKFDLNQPLISNVSWSPAGQVFYQLQNRIQNELKLCQYDPQTGETTVVIDQRVEKGWIESPGNPVWLEDSDGQFIWFTVKDNLRHLATYSADGKIIDEAWTQRSDDPIEIRTMEGIAHDSVFFTATTSGDPTQVQLFRLEKSGTVTMVTNPDKDHRVVFNPSMTYFFDYESDISTPTKIALRRANGEFVRYVDPNLVDYVDYLNISQPVFQKIPTRDGDVLDSMLILPPDFDDAKTYPVIMHVYAGPQAPRVRNRWGGNSYLWHQLMAQKGFVIWMCDNRSATYRGLDKTYPIYGDLGRRELRDIEDSLTWLKKKPWVDSSRIGIWGWSYGGYMTAYAMTHSKSFKAGISGAPVTDWRNYDSIYTERYMGLPQENAKGYRESSVVSSARNLHGRMLIIHGTQDDNVHISNTYQLVNALQNAGRQFDLMIYPKNRHGIRVPAQTLHLRKLMMEYFMKNL